MRAYKELEKDEMHLPVICDGVKVDPVIIEDDDILIQNARIMIGNSIPQIGEVINRFTKVYVTRSKFDRNSKDEEERKQYETLTKRLLCGQCISQSTIDAKKSGKYFEIPKHWYNESHIEFLLEEQEFNRPLVANTNPYFFMYNDIDMKSKYNTWLDSVNVRTISHWGITFDKLKEMNEDDLTEEQQLFIEFANKNCPVSLEDKSTMRTFVDVVEEELKDVRASVSRKVVDNRNLLKFTDVTYDEETYKSVLREYYKYKNSRVDDSKQIYVNGLYDEEEVYLQQKKVKQEREQNKIKLHGDILNLCDNNVQIATNILIDISYDDDTNIALCWELFGSEIINNLLERHDYKVNVVESDEKGDIVYKGKRYTSKIIDIREVEDLDDEFDSDVM